jgi:hypothetical protein
MTLAGANTAERLNNAILAIDGRALADPKWLRKNVDELATLWVNYWNSSERRLSPPLVQAAKLERFTAWYARAWAFQPESLRAELPHPDEIDSTVWSAIEDQLTYEGEGAQAVGKASKELAGELAVAAGKGGRELVKGVVIVGGVAVAVLLALAVAKPKWL